MLLPAEDRQRSGPIPYQSTSLSSFAHIILKLSKADSMTGRVLFLVALCLSTPMLSQDGVSRADSRSTIGFEDQTSTKLSGWYANPPGTVSADDHVAHSGHWSVRIHRDAHSASTSSYITRTMPIDFHGKVIELRGFFRLQDVSGFAGLWMREDAHGQMLALENMWSQQVNGSRDWAEYRITLPVMER